ncbi:HEAT repeat domain-containing protein [Fimbriimonas ginsengisoli]|uniref:HEAT repeat domain-containing protein n=1 Tax=Fimbriimonas ginsengisoli TaxID=1005039 RepID=UPI00130E3642|nr:HEAT repeat domain-containing protein [Fimbriimonas ginsengisoli]
MQRTLRSLLFMIAVGATLAVYNGYNQSHDVALATGPVGSAQRDFFATAADRPDIALFFKGLTPSQRLTMATRIGDYDDPKLGTLIGKLLGSFDAKARVALTASLVRIGKAHPEAVANQLTVAGSLQQFAVASALKAVGAPALPAVATALKTPEARSNAAAYLVANGSSSVSFLLPMLREKDKDVRLAAADALGKLGAKEAVPAIMELYSKSEGDERFGYLSALAGVGDPATEPLLTKEATDLTVAGPRRAQAMLGLGRIGDRMAVSTLWNLLKTDDPQIQDSVISALQLAGNAAISSAPSVADGLKVAAGVHTPEADGYIDRFLRTPEVRLAAARAAENRPGLVAAIAAAAKSTANGEETDALMRALATTPEGVAKLRELAKDPTVGGFAARRLRLSGA